MGKLILFFCLFILVFSVQGQKDPALKALKKTYGKEALNAFKQDERPTQINAIFQFYHIMIAIGMTLIGLTLYASFLWWRKKLFETKWLLWIFSFSVILPQIANQVGWFAAEMGRQPWVVYGHLRTSDAFSQEVSSHQIVFSLIMFTVVYALLLVLFIYMVNKKIKHGPYDEVNEPVNFQSF
jgi:cytochrome d ubiquinol oxidase subunit I